MREADDVAPAIALAHDESPELAVVDLRMPDGTASRWCATLKAIDPTTNVVVLTGYGSIATALEAVRLGATHYLTKPADVDDILARSRAATLRPTQRRASSTPRRRWRASSGSTSTACSPIAVATSPRPRGASGMHRRSLQRKLAKYPVAR